MYFDGISQVSVCKFYSYADGKLSELGNITLYDEKYTTLYCDIIGGDKPYILTMWDNRVITASIDKIKVISDTVSRRLKRRIPQPTAKQKASPKAIPKAIPKAKQTASPKALLTARANKVVILCTKGF